MGIIYGTALFGIKSFPCILISREDDELGRMTADDDFTFKPPTKVAFLNAVKGQSLFYQKNSPAPPLRKV